MSKLKFSALIFGALVFVNPAFGPQNAAFSKDKPVRSGELTSFIQEGEASWYGPGFHGRKTANGERFNTNEMTAAHKTLPFGTVLKVTNLNNDKFCIVRVNDRGPYIRGRIIDLSKAAKNEIGMDGTAPVRIEVYNEEEEVVEEPVEIKLFDETLPLESKIFVEYTDSLTEISKDELNNFFLMTGKIRLKVLTPETADANSTIYQEASLTSTNYLDITKRVKFVEGFTVQVAELQSQVQVDEVVGNLESLHYPSIMIEEIISSGSKSFKVFVGSYKNAEDTNNDREVLSKMGYKVRLVKISN